MRQTDRKAPNKINNQAFNRIEQRLNELDINFKKVTNTTTTTNSNADHINPNGGITDIAEISPMNFPSGGTPTNSPNGQLYVKQTDGDLYYKTVGGGEWKLNHQRWHRSSAFSHASGNSDARMIPLAGGSVTTSDTTPTDLELDDSYYIVPYDLKVTSVKGVFARQGSANPHPGNTTIKLYKTGTALSNAITVNIGQIGYDETDLFKNIWTWDLSKETNTYKAGDIMHIEIDPTNFIYYATLTVIGEYT